MFTRRSSANFESDIDVPIPTPDAYIGLRKMLRLDGWKESLKPFYNFPFEVALVDKARPDAVILNTRTSAYTNKTVLVPDRRHAIINHDVSEQFLCQFCYL